MPTVQSPRYGLFVYYLLQEQVEHSGDYLPEFSRMLAETAADLHFADCHHYGLPTNSTVTDALTRIAATVTDFTNRTHTADTINLLDQAAHDLYTVHPPTSCGWAEDCTVCPALTWLASLIHAYQRLRTEHTTKATA